MKHECRGHGVKKRGEGLMECARRRGLHEWKGLCHQTKIGEVMNREGNGSPMPRRHPLTRKGLKQHKPSDLP